MVIATRAPAKQGRLTGDQRLLTKLKFFNFTVHIRNIMAIMTIKNLNLSNLSIYLIIFESRSPCQKQTLCCGISYGECFSYTLLYLAVCSNDNHLCKGDECDVSDFSEKHFRQNHFFSLPLRC